MLAPDLSYPGRLWEPCTSTANSSCSLVTAIFRVSPRLDTSVYLFSLARVCCFLTQSVSMDSKKKQKIEMSGRQEVKIRGRLGGSFLVLLNFLLFVNLMWAI